MDEERRVEISKFVGSMQQLAYVRPMVCDEGRSRGMKVIEVKNGCMEYQLMCDKCLDMSMLSYKGYNLNFLAKPGLEGRNHYDTNGQEALRSIMGGMFFTAGLENICAPYENETGSYPMHGRIRTTPAEHVCADTVWDGQDMILRVSGEMREAELFGENMVLRRTIETVVGTKTIKVIDEIENQGYRPEPLMILYHINLGYPFLSPGTQLYIPTRKVTARDEAAAGHEAEYDSMEAPKDNEPEYVFLHDLATDGTMAHVLAVNPQLNIGLEVSYDATNLPYFMEWKSIASGDYVIGLEPANSSVYGRGYHEERGDLHMLAPFHKERNELTFTIHDGWEIDDAIRRVQGILAK